MHPPLHRPHPLCQGVIQEIVACHEEYKIGKFFGACNDAKAKLDACFRKEKEEKRSENLRKAREFDKKFSEVMALPKIDS